MSQEQDWLEADNVEARLKQRGQAIEFSKLYLVFETHPGAKALLEHWDKTLLRKRVPVNASINEYAAVESLRTFVQQIHEQIALAHSE